MDDLNPAPAALGAAFRAAREAAGLTLQQASVRLCDYLPPGQLCKTGETIRQYELGHFRPDDAVVVLVLLALARVYKAEVINLTADNRRDFAKLEELINSPWFSIVCHASTYPRVAAS